jgi:flagellar basal body rod protein FlgG
MSMIECGWCGGFCDTDNGEGAFERNGKLRYKCDNCLEEDGECVSKDGYITVDQDALDNANEAAWERQQAANLECPPVTMQEQHKQAWKQKQGIKS